MQRNRHELGFPTSAEQAEWMGRRQARYRAACEANPVEFRSARTCQAVCRVLTNINVPHTVLDGQTLLIAYEGRSVVAGLLDNLDRAYRWGGAEAVRAVRPLLRHDSIVMPHQAAVRYRLGRREETPARLEVDGVVVLTASDRAAA